MGDESLAEFQRLLRTGKLCADYVQMAHHGQGGVEKDVYEEIAPKACFWNTPGWLWDNRDIFKTLIVRGWIEELGITENYVLKDGLQVIEL